MGEVYRARDERLGREVAVKVLSPRLAREARTLRRFAREARAVGALNHPNVLDIHDVGEHEGTPYVVSELLEGQTLRELLQARLTVHKAIEIGVQVARGLAAAHDKGVVHRDLKPANVFVARDGHVKILDFGLARLLGAREGGAADGDTAPTVSDGEAAAGTIGYMAPEQVRGQPVDARADVFALGVVLYEMLAGAPPFRGESAVDTQSAVLHADPPPIAARRPGVPPVLEALVRRSLEKRPEERFQSARDLAFALESVLTGEGSSGRSRPPVRPVRRTWRGWGRLALGAGAVAALAAAALAGRALLPRRPAVADPSRLAPRQVTAEPGAEADPALAPDGSLVAYVVAGAKGADLWLKDVRGGPELRLTDDAAADSLPAWFPDGSALAFVSTRDGREGIWKVHRLGGPPSPLLPDALDPAVSPDARRLAFVRRAPSGHTRVGVVEIARPETARLVTGDGDGDPLWDHRFPAWSPDGRWLCYSDVQNLWLVPADGGPARPLTREHTRDAHPAFAPDGRHVYYSSGREGTHAIWRVTLDGAPPQRITFGTGPETHPSLASTGTRLAYTTYSAQPDLALVDRLTGEKVQLPRPGPVEAPAFLPDGRGVVYGCRCDNEWDLWVQPLERGRPAGAPRRLTEQAGAEAVAAPTPDGRWIAYCRVLREERKLFVVPAGGGVPRPLVDHPSNGIQPAWAPDGTWLAFVSDRDGRQHVYVAPARDGALAGPPVRLTGGEATDNLPAWSPDGRHLAFVREEGEDAEAFVVPATPPAVARRLTRGARARCARFEPDGRALLVSGWWGGRAVTLMRVPLEAGRPEPLPHPVELGDTPDAILFNLSPDGRWVVFDERKPRGHVWVLEAKEGRF
jgi:Tol biopolymer transport system component/tRNA A-37 threonylcarbamoyl transferase component Bud32